MMLSHTCTGRVGGIALVFLLAGCSDFSQHRFGGIRRSTDAEEGPPTPAPALAIPNAPSAARFNPDDKVKAATFVPLRDLPMQPQVGPTPQMLEQPLRVLYQRAAQRHAAMDSYIVRLKRREVVNGRAHPEELIRVQIRRDPYSVYLKWLGKEGKGREAIYVKGKSKDEMQLLLAAGDMFPLSPAGMRFSLAPGDPLARAKSRYPITETGLGVLIERYGRMVAAVEKGDPRDGTAKYLGRVQRPEFEAKVEAVHQVLPAGSDPLLPKGGQRWWYFDATTGLPALVITHGPDGEVEYYCYDYLQWPAPMDDDDFNPDRVWRK
jgi:Protein of unknown function (DUF1571)